MKSLLISILAAILILIYVISAATGDILSAIERHRPVLFADTLRLDVAIRQGGILNLYEDGSQVIAAKEK